MLCVLPCCAAATSRPKHPELLLGGVNYPDPLESSGSGAFGSMFDVSGMFTWP